MKIETLKWYGSVDGYLELTDQRKLPAQYVKIKCHTVTQVFDAIKTLAVRGAPAIGVAAAYGVVIGLKDSDANDISAYSEKLNQTCDHLAQSRPTAVNLFWALDRMKKAAKDYPGNPADLPAHLLTEAHAIYSEDRQMCQNIGANGQHFITEGAGVLTHCNAGALATAGDGTALALMFAAHRKGKHFRVWADETRPLLQGARLTAWELQTAGIDVTLICDNMAGWLMRQGKIDCVITGADRIAANGDSANKIGTYSLSVLAKAHGIKFYIAAPSSTFDLSIKNGDLIPIEERKPDEVRGFADTCWVPPDVKVWNPAFDVVPAENITAIITEKGVIDQISAKKIAEHLK